jgi:hypothetical protein
MTTEQKPLGIKHAKITGQIMRDHWGPIVDRIADEIADPAAEWQAGYEAGVKAAAKALEADAKLCDCAALEDRECACGAWDDYKSITSARAVEIVRALQEQSK